MKGYVNNLEEEALANNYFRKVVYTDARLQLVVMALKPLEDIGMESHHLDQFIRIEKGEGKAILDGEEHALTDGSVVIVPAETMHNIMNTSADKPMKLYTLYAPPNHRDGVVHHTRAAAEADNEHFDGKTTE